MLPQGVPAALEVEVSEAESGLPETTEQALSLSKERLSTQKGVSDGGEQSVEAQAAANVSDSGTKGDAQSGGATADFSFLGDPNLRSAFEQASLPPEAVHAMKAWAADYTRKSQALREAESKAQAWDALEGMPGSRQAIAELLAQPDASSESEPEELVDLTSADNETIWKAIRTEAAKLAREVAEQTLQERVIAPVSERQQIVDSAKALWPKWQGRLDEAGFKQAWGEALAHYGEDSFNPQNTPFLFEPFLKHAASARELEAIKGGRSREVDIAKKATSPTGSSSSVSRSIRDDLRTGPADKKSLRDITRKQIMERFGWSESDLNRAASSG